MIASTLLSLATVAMPSWCTAPVHIVKDEPLAYYDYNKDAIYLSTSLRRSEVAHAVKHECAHALEDQRNIEIPDYFGKPPFVTEYAATSKYESFAEVVAFELAGKKQRGMKGVYVRRILREISWPSRLFHESSVQVANPKH